MVSPVCRPVVAIRKASVLAATVGMYTHAYPERVAQSGREGGGWGWGVGG